MKINMNITKDEAIAMLSVVNEYAKLYPCSLKKIMEREYNKIVDQIKGDEILKDPITYKSPCYSVTVDRLKDDDYNRIYWMELEFKDEAVLDGMEFLNSISSSLKPIVIAIYGFVGMAKSSVKEIIAKGKTLIQKYSVREEDKVYGVVTGTIDDPFNPDKKIDYGAIFCDDGYNRRDKVETTIFDTGRFNRNEVETISKIINAKLRNVKVEMNISTFDEADKAIMEFHKNNGK